MDGIENKTFWLFQSLSLKQIYRDDQSNNTLIDWWLLNATFAHKDYIAVSPPIRDNERKLFENMISTVPFETLVSSNPLSGVLW